MSKFKIAKKTLAVFLAALMVLSSWGGLTPFSFKAKAVTAGMYEVEITWYLDNKRDAKWSADSYNSYTGESSFKKNSNTTNNAGISLFYKKENGTDDTEYEVYWDLGYANMSCGEASGSGATVVNKSGAWLNTSTQGAYTLTATIPGFPTKLFACMDEAHTNVAGLGYVTAYSVRSIKVNNTVIWASDGTDKSGIYLESNNKRAYITLNSDYSWSGSSNGSTSNESDPDGKANVNNVKTKNWAFPKATKIVWDTTPTATKTISKTDGTTVSNTAKFHVEDQYGVTLSTEALGSLGASMSATVTSTNYPTKDYSGTTHTSLGTDSSADLYYTTKDTSSSYNVTVSAESTLKSTELGLNERTVTVTAKAGGLSDSKKFKIYDPKYTVTFNKGTDDTNAKEMSPATAQVYYGETLESQSELDKETLYPTAGNWPGRTWLGMYDGEGSGANEMDINEVVTANKTYFAHWNENTYTVVFLDRDGSFLDAKYCPYGGTVSTEDADKKLSSFVKANADEHWALKTDGRWATADDAAFVGDETAVNSNLIVIAQYDIAKHNFGDPKPLEATCQHGSGTVEICKDCGYEKETIYPDSSAVDHAASDTMTVVLEPTCTKKGKGVYYCKYCGAEIVKEEEIPALGHSYTIKEIKAATCTSEGEYGYTCTREGCSHTKTENTPKLQHNMVAQPEVGATCTSGAYTPYKCANCDHSYNVYNETQPAIGHVWGEWTVTTAATNTEKGKMERQCEKCDEVQEVEIPAGGHKFATVPTLEEKATCTTEGSQTFTCTAHVDGEGNNTCGVSITVTTAKIAHTYTTTKTDAKCETAGSVVSKCECGNEITTEIPATGHTYDEGEVTVPATCTAAGTILQKCSCGNTRNITIPATGHKYVEIPATCTEDGKKVCACGDVTAGVTKKEHEYKNEETVLEPTCVSQGIKTSTCDCGAVKIDIISKADHTYGDFVTDFYRTCTTAGRKSKHCKVCGNQTEITPISALGHTVDTTKEPTKTTNSNATNPCLNTVTKTWKCDHCDYTKVEVVAATGHNFEESESKAATCGEAGYKVMKCACGESYTVIDGQATENHNWKYSATNNDNKLTVTVTCLTCGATYTTEEIDVAEGHTYNKVEVTKYPTCKDAGSITISCSSDHDGKGCTAPSYTAALPSDPEKGIHKNITTVYESKATCTSEGKVIVKCSDCNKQIGEAQTIPATGHTFDTTNSTYTTYAKGNCKTPATVTLKCTTAGCDHSETYTLGIDTNAHVYGEAVNHEATCTTPAYDIYTCTVDGCDYSYNEYDGTSKALGHNWKATIAQTGTVVTVTLKCDCGEEKTLNGTGLVGHNYSKFEFVQATCSQEGKVTISCSDDGCTGKLEFTIEKDSSIHTNLVTKVQDATCTADGRAYTYCNDCEKEVGTSATISKTGHDFYTNLATTTADPAPTCTTEGKKTVQCAHCDATQEVTVPKLGHLYEKAEGEGKKATCTDYGWDVYKCQNDGCDESYKALIEATGHNVPTFTTKNATCTEGGYSEGYCTNCGQTVRFNETPATGHDFENEGEVINEGNCVEQKIIKHVCNNGCGEASYEYIGEVGSHDYVFVERKEAICGERSYDLYKCKKCGDEEKRNFGELLEHDWDFWTITKYPTDTEPGSQERECLRCKLKEIQEITSGDFYLVTFYNFDGTRLIRPAFYSYGSAAKMPSKTPTRPNDAAYTYTFKGYSYSKADINCVTKQMAIMAEYEATERIYDVTYCDANGNAIQTVSAVPYSQLTQTYTGATPTKAEDENYTYTFDGWTVSCNTETLKATATPSFTAKLKPSASTGGQEGILTRFVEWIKNLFKSIFGKLFG